MSPPAVPARLEATFGAGRAWASKSDGSATAWETPAFHLLWSPQAITETALRRLWEARKGRQAYAVVALAPSDDQDTRSSSPVPQDARPIRQLLQDRVFDLLAKCSDLVPRESAATLTREFSRLEESVVPGLRVKDLLTPHFLRERLPQAPNARHLPDVVKSVSRPQNLSWRSVFQSLGYQVRSLQPRGYLLQADNAPVAVVHALNDPSLFSRLTKNGELPEGMVLADCEKQGAHWGVLAAGTRYRLFQRKPPIGPATGQYLEIDLAELESQNRWYLGLLAPQSLRRTRLAHRLDSGSQGLRPESCAKVSRNASSRTRCPTSPTDSANSSNRKARTSATASSYSKSRKRPSRSYSASCSCSTPKPAATCPSARPPTDRTAPAELADDSRPGRGPFRRRSTRRWDRLRTLVRMVRTGDKIRWSARLQRQPLRPRRLPGQRPA